MTWDMIWPWAVGIGVMALFRWIAGQAYAAGYEAGKAALAPTPAEPEEEK